MTLGFVELDWEARGHLKAALDAHIERLRFFDRPVPAAITALADSLVAVADIRDETAPAVADAGRVQFTYQETANRLGISPRTVRDYVKDGKLTAVGTGRGRRILASSLHELAAGEETA